MNAPATTVNPPTTESLTVRRIAILAALLGAVAALVMNVTGGRDAALSSAVGTFVGVANLWVLQTLVTRIFNGTAEAPTKKGVATALLALKTVTLFVVVWLILRVSWIRGGSFMVGITAAVTAILAGGLWGALDAPGSSHDSDKGKH